MSSHASLTQERVAEITAARDYWKEWAEGEQRRADKGWATQASAATGRFVVECYNRELNTGKPHCSHCGRPVAECGQSKQNGFR